MVGLYLYILPPVVFDDVTCMVYYLDADPKILSLHNAIGGHEDNLVIGWFVAHEFAKTLAGCNGHEHDQNE